MTHVNTPLALLRRHIKMDYQVGLLPARAHNEIHILYTVYGLNWFISTIGLHQNLT